MLDLDHFVCHPVVSRQEKVYALKKGAKIKKKLLFYFKDLIKIHWRDTFFWRDMALCK